MHLNTISTTNNATKVTARFFSRLISFHVLEFTRMTRQKHEEALRIRLEDVFTFDQMDN